MHSDQTTKNTTNNQLQPKQTVPPSTYITRNAHFYIFYHTYILISRMLMKSTQKEAP